MAINIEKKNTSDKIEVISSSGLFAEAIRRTFNYESISPSIIEAVVELMEKDEAESGSKAMCQNQV